MSKRRNTRMAERVCGKDGRGGKGSPSDDCHYTLRQDVGGKSASELMYLVATSSTATSCLDSIIASFLGNFDSPSLAKREPPPRSGRCQKIETTCPDEQNRSVYDNVVEKGIDFWFIDSFVYLSSMMSPIQFTLTALRSASSQSGPSIRMERCALESICITEA